MSDQKQYRGIPIGGTDFVFGWYAKVPVVFPNGTTAFQHYIIPYDEEVGAPWIEILDSGIEAIAGGLEKVIPETVNQQIGLKDKNGVELDWWEGDVFELYGQSTTYKIIYLEGCYYFESTVTGQRYICGKAALWFHPPIKLGDSQTIFMPQEADNE